MYYRRLCSTVQDRGELLPLDNKMECFDSEIDHYVSIYEYDDAQLAEFKNKGTVSGINNVTTTRLIWDFDDKNSLENARQDTIELCGRLQDKGVDTTKIQIFFSGSKGFHVQVDTVDRLTVEQFKRITYELANGLNSYDSTISNATRIVRVCGTKHKETGLYKIPITAEQLQEYSIEDIKEMAIEFVPHKSPGAIVVPPQLKQLQLTSVKTNETPLSPTYDIDFDHKIKGWSNCKWAMTQGYGLKSGDRHDKLVCLIATAKSLNYSQEQAYYNAKNAAFQGWKRYGGEKIVKEELWKTVESIYSTPMEGRHL